MWHYKVHCILQFPPSTSQTISCNLDKVQQFTCKMHQTKFSKKQNNYTSLFDFQTLWKNVHGIYKSKNMAWNHDCFTELIVYCTCIMPSSLSHINITQTGI